MFPDISELSGDPWYRGQPSEAPDDSDVQAELEALKRRIDSMPAGSLSGGHPVRDDFDPSTWGPEDPFVKEFLGPVRNEGLSASEKNLLWDAGSRAIKGKSRADFEAAKQGQAHADLLWSEFQQAHPRAATDLKQVEQAALSVMNEMKADGTWEDEMLGAKRHDFYHRVAMEISYGSAARGGYGEDNRTGGTGSYGNYSRGPAASQPSDTAPDDMNSALFKRQRSEGWY
jgi:hypothetical protein